MHVARLCASPPNRHQRGERGKAEGFFCETMPLVHHQRVTVVFANSAALNQVLKHERSAFQTNWILSMKIGGIFQGRACLLPYLKRRRRPTLCCLIAIGLKIHPFLRPPLYPQLPLHFWLHVLLDRQNPKATYRGEISRGETPLMMM